RAQTYRGFPSGFQSTVSIGVAIFDHETMVETESLIRMADGALYEAKRNGKNRVVVAAPQGEKS
ncbi:MAG: diguanylate cyclase, partial [Candidatus Hydrogenedentes bacterium]|nr:diguanylate cyclase [Candidatus Hydrogenedentota bacterium]